MLKSMSVQPNSHFRGSMVVGSAPQTHIVTPNGDEDLRDDGGGGNEKAGASSFKRASYVSN